MERSSYESNWDCTKKDRRLFVPDAPMFFGKWKTGDRSKEPMRQTYKGKLKLAIYHNNGLLTVHVMKARHLSSNWNLHCDVYVKVCIVPDDSGVAKCRTAIVPCNNNPSFDEKFSFELLADDVEKRLLLSVVNRRGDRNEFLGCMSFGISSLYDKSIDGWYYLLAGEIGSRKHVSASSKSNMTTVGQNDRKDKTADSNTAAAPDARMEQISITLHKDASKTYGFKMAGCSPVVVTNVVPGSPAVVAGLKPDDRIVAVNSFQVFHSSCGSVARIIGKFPKKMVVHVQRLHQVVQIFETPRRSPVKRKAKSAVGKILKKKKRTFLGISSSW